MTKLNEMWDALEKHQEEANEWGHGVSWAKMCELKTEEAARSAGKAASYAAYYYAAAGYVAADAAYAAARAAFDVKAFVALTNDDDTVDVAARAYWATVAIEQINKAQRDD